MAIHLVELVRTAHSIIITLWLIEQATSLIGRQRFIIMLAFFKCIAKI